MKYFFTFCFLGLFMAANYGQATLSGTVQDSSGTSLPGANVVLLKAADSLLVGFGSTDRQGRFQIENVSPGNYILRCSFLGYQRPEQPIEVGTDDQLLGLGDLVMYPEGYFLDGIEVNGYRIPIRMRGDTMVFDADAFQTGPNSVVEDLLRRLPGLSVRADGSLLFQGKAVDEVMVNGKPFFQGNTQLVTQNMDAVAIDKVEVYDQQTDREVISGQDDGEERITVNLEMKEEAKNQFFGRIYAGGGTAERYRGGGKAFRIGDRSQFGIIGLINNINEVGFSPQTALGFGAGFGSFGGGIMLGGNDGQLPINFQSSVSGDNRTISSGLNYGTSVGKHGNLSASYILLDRQQRQLLEQKDVFTGNLAGRVTEITQNLNANTFSHRLNLAYDHKTDTTATLRLNMAAFLTGQRENDLAQTRIFDQAALDQDYLQDRFTKTDNPFFSADFSYNRRLGKVGRTLDINQRFRYGKPESSNRSNVTGLRPGTLTGGGLPANGLQVYATGTEQYTIGTSLGYNEPLSKRLSLRSSIGMDVGQDAGNYSLDYENENALSASLENRTTNLQISSGLRKQWKDNSLAIAGRLHQLEWKLDGDQNQSFSRNWIAPEVNFRLGMKRGNFRIFTTGQPSVPNNNQLLTFGDAGQGGTVRLGNPDLTPSFNYILGGSYFYIDQFSGFNFNLGARATYQDNPISNSISFAEGVQVYRPINVSHGWQQGFNFNVNQDLNFIDANIGIASNARFTTSLGQFETSLFDQFTQDYELSANVTKRLNNESYLELVYSYFYNRNRIDDNNAPLITSTNSQLILSTGLEFNPKWRLEADFGLDNFKAGDLGDATQLTVLNASLEIRPFNKAPHFFTLSGNDLLNQNQTVSRTVQPFFTRESSSNTLGRYFLLTFNWKL